MKEKQQQKVDKGEKMDDNELLKDEKRVLIFGDENAV